MSLNNERNGVIFARRACCVFLLFPGKPVVMTSVAKVKTQCDAGTKRKKKEKKEEN